MTEITYRATKTIPPRSVQARFRRMEYSDWWTLKDIAWYLGRAVHVVSTWHTRLRASQ